ncbi:hypothetical protein BDN70DRAFT_911641 [Pholiota conissans]|uniref:DUF4470 domain-containing protein n=1 Tax=Pholiota conissans TaxID=109636 RepID=A0A9P5Z6Y4_9AGAR|nr:hypothetical protein BDN70DRAFT_911641 [Pholiota conissans]
MFVDNRYYREILSRIHGPLFAMSSTHLSNSSSTQSLESYMSYRLGSGRVEKPVPHLLCSKSIRKPGQCTCPTLGQCQRQHRSKRRPDCKHLYLNPEWEPTWVIEDRRPLLSASLYHHHLSMPTKTQAFLPAGDVRNLVQTVNSLPNNYSGKLDILLNNSNAVVLNRMLVILCILLNPRPTHEESAELATHLMYTASLSETGASYVRHCAKIIYGQEFRDGDLSFQASLKTRGRGKLYAAQPTASIKRPVEMLFSSYTMNQSLANRKEELQDLFHADDRHKILSSLRPSHRLALHKFWETGILLPFSMGITDFTSPNRLLFNPQGEWMGMVSDINPLHGWDVAAVQCTGSQYGISSDGDILGSLFFHVKSELREFSYDSRLVSKGISIGLFPAFSEASFDRIDIGDMGDKMGVAESLADWAPLLNKGNQSSCLIMHSKPWHEEFPTSIAHNNPRAMKILMERLQKVHSLGPQDSSVDRLMASLDAFRVGIPLHPASQTLPNLSKEEFYEFLTLGGADLTLRFAEFESAAFGSDM